MPTIAQPQPCSEPGGADARDLPQERSGRGGAGSREFGTQEFVIAATDLPGRSSYLWGEWARSDSVHIRGVEERHQQARVSEVGQMPAALDDLRAAATPVQRRLRRSKHAFVRRQGFFCRAMHSGPWCPCWAKRTCRAQGDLGAQIEEPKELRLRLKRNGPGPDTGTSRSSQRSWFTPRCERETRVFPAGRSAVPPSADAAELLADRLAG